MRAQILVVEPESALQAALSAWLEWEGYDCICASDREDALAIVEHDPDHDHDPVDVVLVSDHGTAWSAHGLAGELKALREDLAIVLLCGTGGCKPRPRRSADVIEEIPAPITRGAVIKAVVRALQWRAASPADRRACLSLEEAMGQQAEILRDACVAAVAADAGSLVGPTSGVAALMERRAPGAVAHGMRVADMARLLGGALNLSTRALGALERAAFLHDLGKAALPDLLLQKPGPLSDLEIGLLRRHPQIAFDILAEIPSLDEVAAIVLSTQERFDGSGYPRALAAVEIPMAARIISLVDAFDRLMTGHPLGPRLSLPEACAELVRGAGTQFDPDLVRIWLRTADGWHANVPPAIAGAHAPAPVADRTMGIPPAPAWRATPSTPVRSHPF